MAESARESKGLGRHRQAVAVWHPLATHHTHGFWHVGGGSTGTVRRHRLSRTACLSAAISADSARERRFSAVTNRGVANGPTTDTTQDMTCTRNPNP